MSLDWLKSLMLDGTPVYYIMYYHVYTASIGRIDADRHATYLTLDDGAVINTANFGKSAFWSKSEADKALAGEVATGGKNHA